jgi:hypothetical protein
MSLFSLKFSLVLGVAAEQSAALDYLFYLVGVGRKAVSFACR